VNSISPEPMARVRPPAPWLELLKVSDVWASLAISAMWLAVACDAIWGPSIESTTPGGTSTSVPSAVVAAIFAFLGTWVVARHGLRNDKD
jgi:hypothetical protein